MGYTETQIREAFLQDEVARYAGMLGRPQRTLEGVALTSRDDREDLERELTHSVVDSARYELTAAKHGLGPEDVEAAVMALTAGEKDERSQAEALVALAWMPANEIMRLAHEPCRCCGGTVPVMGGGFGGLLLTVTEEERYKLAKAGHAMIGGHFPIPDAKHLGYAKAFFKQGKHAGQDPAEIRAHINRNAKRLGLPGLDDDDGDEDSDITGPKPKASRHPRHATKPVQVVRRGQRAAAEGGGPDGGGGPGGGGGAAMTVSLADDPVGYYVALAAEENVSSGPLRAHFDFEIHDVGTHPESGSPGVDVEREIARYLAQCSERPQSGNRKGRLAGRYPGTGPSGKPQSYR